MKLLADIFTWEGSRKAQFCAATAIAVASYPQLTWPLITICGIFVLGRAAHDVAIELKKTSA